MNCGLWRKRIVAFTKFECRGRLTAAQLVAKHRLAKGSRAWANFGTDRNGDAKPDGPKRRKLKEPLDQEHAHEDEGYELDRGDYEVNNVVQENTEGCMAGDSDTTYGIETKDMSADADMYGNVEAQGGPPRGSHASNGARRGAKTRYIEDQSGAMDEEARAPFQIEDSLEEGAFAAPPSELAGDGCIECEVTQDDASGQIADADSTQEVRRVRRRLNSKTPQEATVYGHERAVCGDGGVAEGQGLLTHKKATAEANRQKAKRRRRAAAGRQVEAEAWRTVENIAAGGTAVGGIESHGSAPRSGTNSGPAGLGGEWFSGELKRHCVQDAWAAHP